VWIDEVYKLLMVTRTDPRANKEAVGALVGGEDRFSQGFGNNTKRI